MDIALANALKKRFITRADAKAIQTLDGEYHPVRDRDKNLLPWSNDDLREHLELEQTYGHYMLGGENKCKLFAFDIDLADQEVPLGIDLIEETPPVLANARQAWRTRSHPSRPWIKWQMRLCGQELGRAIFEHLEIPLAMAYSGHKGVHVYGFTGKVDASDCIGGAQIVLDNLGGWSRHPQFKTLWVWDKYPIFNFEIYPKQATVPTDGFGNLMRLPLGRNLKSPKDPTFFVDMTAPLAELRPTDSLWALTEGANNPWKKPTE